MVLRKVITTLTADKKDKGKDFVPYRESKLTSLLKQSLGGNSYTLMMACLGPCDAFRDENASTLQYAARASMISNQVHKNLDPRLAVIEDQRKKIQNTEKELKNATSHIMTLNMLNTDKDKKIEDLIAENAKLKAEL
jgi:kinesin family protein 4/21/27